jgi:hypothetical protein
MVGDFGNVAVALPLGTFLRPFQRAFAMKKLLQKKKVVEDLVASYQQLEPEFQKDLVDWKRDLIGQGTLKSKTDRLANLANKIAHAFQESGKISEADAWFERKHRCLEFSLAFGEKPRIDPNHPKMLVISSLHYRRTKQYAGTHAQSDLADLSRWVHEDFENCKAGDFPDEAVIKDRLDQFAELSKTFDLQAVVKNYQNGCVSLRNGGYVGEIGLAANGLRRMVNAMDNGGITPFQRQEIVDSCAEAQCEIADGFLSVKVWLRCFWAIEALSQIEAKLLRPLILMLQNVAHYSRSEKMPKLALDQLKILKFKLMQQPIELTSSTVILPATPTYAKSTAANKGLSL